jgi:two-component system, chemotaxis family, sensor kinase CheA
MIHKPVLDAALEKQKENTKAEERKSRSIRIDSEKLDELINIIGELVITGANVRQIAERIESEDIIQPVLTMSRLVEDVRDRIMNIRMVQIGETFKRFERVVHDMSRENGKEVDLIINGGDTELDKTIIEKINDPLMHLIRNSLDHGIGKPEERIKSGKSRRGSVSLNAYNETGNIVIEIKDDGNGLNREKIYKKAVESGLLQQNQHVDDLDLYQYIFQPGFSTAEKVTNISGRGVGMDVVKKNIESLRGTIVLESTEGVGMTTRIHLPLTLAIIDGFLVQVSDSYYVIPLDLVSEVFEVNKNDLKGKEGASIINLRGEVLPYMRLRDFFEDTAGETLTENVIVVEYARKKAGLVVDRLVGEFQTVIKSLGKLFMELQWVSGATILGNGEVAFILDVPRLIQSGRGNL